MDGLSCIVPCHFCMLSLQFNSFSKNIGNQFSHFRMLKIFSFDVRKVQKHKISKKINLKKGLNPKC